MLNINSYISDFNYTTLGPYESGITWYINAPSGVIVSGVTVSYSYNSGIVIDALSQTNTDGGNNFGWLFYTPPSNTLGSTFYIQIINKRVTPYRINSNDYIQIGAKVYLNKEKKLSYIKDVPLTLSLNYTSGWVAYETSTTDRLGSCNFYHSCSGINVNSCLGFVSGVINNKMYQSNITRINFTPPATVPTEKTIVNIYLDIYTGLYLGGSYETRDYYKELAYDALELLFANNNGETITYAQWSQTIIDAVGSNPGLILVFIFHDDVSSGPIMLWPTLGDADITFAPNTKGRFNRAPPTNFTKFS